jgi:serine/threonine protein kinase
MRDLRHENLSPFLGACVETGHVFMLSPYCSRGNLQDVLNNEDYRLDQMFMASLISDLIKVSNR